MVNNRIKKDKEPIKNDLEYTPGNADTIQIKLLESINRNLVVLINEVKNGRQSK